MFQLYYRSHDTWQQPTAQALTDTDKCTDRLPDESEKTETYM